MNNLQAKQLINSLYNAVDNKDLSFLNDIMTDDVNFRIGNFDTIVDKSTALSANKAFFDSIGSMSHTIEKIWHLGNDILCNGKVDYVRLDGSEYSAYFCTVLTIKADKIAEYYVYADISQL